MHPIDVQRLVWNRELFGRHRWLAEHDVVSSDRPLRSGLSGEAEAKALLRPNITRAGARFLLETSARGDEYEQERTSW